MHKIGSGCPRWHKFNNNLWRRNEDTCVFSKNVPRRKVTLKMPKRPTEMQSRVQHNAQRCTSKNVNDKTLLQIKTFDGYKISGRGKGWLKDAQRGAMGYHSRLTAGAVSKLLCRYSRGLECSEMHQRRRKNWSTVMQCIINFIV